MGSQPPAGLDPSPWVLRWARMIPQGEVLDLACGRGRHVRVFTSLGHDVTALDRDAEALSGLGGIRGVRTLQADLEGGQPWPLAGRHFAGIVVTNYLHRPLFAHLLAALEDGGVLIYETFMLGNERYGRPSNPEFLLRPGELLDAFGRALTVVAFEQGVVGEPPRAVAQRFCGVRGGADAARLD